MYEDAFPDRLRQCHQAFAGGAVGAKVGVAHRFHQVLAVGVVGGEVHDRCPFGRLEVHTVALGRFHKARQVLEHAKCSLRWRCCLGRQELDDHLYVRALGGDIKKLPHNCPEKGAVGGSERRAVVDHEEISHGARGIPQPRLAQQTVNVQVEVGRRTHSDAAVGFNAKPPLEELKLVTGKEGPIHLDGVLPSEVRQQGVHSLLVASQHGVVHVHLCRFSLLAEDVDKVGTSIMASIGPEPPNPRSGGAPRRCPGNILPSFHRFGP